MYTRSIAMTCAAVVMTVVGLSSFDVACGRLPALPPRISRL